MAGQSSAAMHHDRRIVLWVLAAMFALALAVTIFAPQQADDPSPTTYNAGTHGTKAAYLLVSELGYGARRWDSPLSDLRNVDAAHTTLILAQPQLPLDGIKPLQQAIDDFLKRGGRVLATGANGATLLPGGKTGQPTNPYEGLCYTRSQGAPQGELAQTGPVPMVAPVRWTAEGNQYTVAQRCGGDAVVVSYPVGAGEAIWWSSPMPLTNGALSDDPSLKLVLATLGAPGRTVLFDEYLHAVHESLKDTLAGLPWHALAWQGTALGALLLFSFSRRHGPLRTPLSLQRTSPIEFAKSMGQLYHKAGATQAATEAARGRLVDLLREQCGIPRDVLREHPPAMAQLLTERFGGEWAELDRHLAQAGQATGTALAPKSALKLVVSLDADYRRLRELAAGKARRG